MKQKEHATRCLEAIADIFQARADTIKTVFKDETAQTTDKAKSVLGVIPTLVSALGYGLYGCLPASVRDFSHTGN